MNPTFFQRIEDILHTERIDVYRRDGADHALTLARYTLNMALSESLYPTLQFSEIALRNAVHRALTIRYGIDAWYDAPLARLSPWQQDKIQEAKNSLMQNGKAVTPGRMVAELNFGFWTGFFNKFHAQTGLGHYLARHVFVHAPKSARDLAKLDTRWKSIRDLRNRVFHHERILHWTDLDARQRAVLELISWISPELHDLAKALDRFAVIRAGGFTPWMQKIQQNWPAPAPEDSAP